MNETLKILKSRRTTRKFLETQIKEEELQEILEAGLYAPSAHNDQSWHFTVVQSNDLLIELDKATKEAAKKIPNEWVQNMANNEKFNIFYHAPTVIVISGRNDAIMPEVDCAAATENMLIAAEALDIGACWNGFIAFLFKSDKLAEYKKKLKISDDYTPYYAVALGYKGFKGMNAPTRKENLVQYIR